MLIEPKISIITVNFNDKLGLERTIESVQNQSFQNFEHIIIDGNSTDGSKEYIETNKSSFSYWVSEPDNGVYSAMNKGINASKGEYLYFLNSGDYLNSSDSLEITSKYLGEKDMVFFNINLLENQRSFVKKVPEYLSFLYLHNNVPPHQATFTRKELYNTIGLFDESLKIVSDWKFLMLALIKKNATYKCVDEIFSTYVRGGLSSSDGSFEAMDKERRNVLEKEFPILLNDLKEFNKLNRVMRNLRKSNKIKLLVKLGLIDKF